MSAECCECHARSVQRKGASPVGDRNLTASNAGVEVVIRCTMAIYHVTCCVIDYCLICLPVVSTLYCFVMGGQHVRALASTSAFASVMFHAGASQLPDRAHFAFPLLADNYDVEILCEDDDGSRLQPMY